MDPNMDNGKIRLRPYQTRVVDDAGSENAIIKMPTGSGKTYVAAELIHRALLSSDKENAALFLVPNRELVTQQAAAINTYFEPILKEDFAIFKHVGGNAPPALNSYAQTFKILVSTPQAFVHLQSKSMFGWHIFSIVVFDEVHHAIKKHPYRHLALDLKHWKSKKPPQQKIPQVIGLTASLTYAVYEFQMVQAVNKLLADFCITKTIFPSEQELEEGGYHGHTSGKDEGVVIAIEQQSNHAPEGVLPEWQRKPHARYAQFMERVGLKRTTKEAALVYHAVEALEKMACNYQSNFQSSLSNPCLTTGEKYAHSCFLSGNQRTRGFFRNLENWYVALRILITSYEEEAAVCFWWLKMQRAFDGVEDLAEIKATRELAADYPCHKMDQLCQTIEKSKSGLQDDLRCLVFCQERISALVLSEYIQHKTKIKTKFMTSQGSHVTPSIKMNPTLVKETIKDFRSGKISILVTTSVLEEGFDVPEANAVISYHSLNNSVELCQRFGRARRGKRGLVLMAERPDRSLTMLESSLATQNEMMNNFGPQSTDNVNQQTKRRQIPKFHDQVLKAHHYLLSEWNEHGNEHMKMLNEYKQKSTATLGIEFHQSLEQNYRCTLDISFDADAPRCAIIGEGRSKNEAKNAAAKRMLSYLKKIKV
eukprot:CAMPEP_0118679996 /NCGR_PEP_ID=MMETSP0800-20121206/4102_1 /TAXON_ID=210618 ORGANISM="Striatella unipunctata, Strain CCMP2910" /NCGR_SAMPLE_ID=MMETSP0800 /ASSEMBLY_ACC=CAM_ASM_000638 /LENGTH=648 /DNA_ID=CAMNT_0006576061 /DNA_START=215 /DNA_END=2161 /DNA_ORIENTATION=+